MIDATMSAVELLLAAEGVPKASLATVRRIVMDKGMVRIGEACRALGCSRITVIRMCEHHGVRRVARPGKLGSLVDLPGLIAAAGRGEGSAISGKAR